MESRRRFIGGLLLFIAVLCALAMFVAGILLAYGQVQHGDKVFTGVESAGVDLGGETRAGAIAALSERFDAFNQQPLTFTAGESSLQATPEQLGLTFDAETTADRAYVFGRTDSLWRESRHWLDALLGGYEVEPVMAVDAATFGAWLESRAPEIVRAPRDATFIVTSGEGVVIDPGSSGIAVDVEATFERFRDRVMTFSNDPVEIVTLEIAPGTTNPELEAVYAEVQAIADDPLELAVDGNIWQIGAQDLLAMIDVRDRDEGVQIELDRAELQSFIRPLAPSVFATPSDAGIRNDGGTFTVTPPTIGRKLDVAASVDAAMAALKSGGARVELVTAPIQPNISEQTALDAKASAEQMIAQPINVTWDGGTATLDPAMLAQAVTFNVNASRNPAITFSFDEEQMNRALALVANSVKVEGKNAELRWINGAVEVRAPESPGRELDVPATIDRIVTALEDGTSEIAIVTRDVPPAVNAAMAGNIQFPDRLQVGQTEYGSSSADRFHNVELAANRVNGAMVAPGQVFSMNAALGPVTYDSGYRTGYGIVATNGSISTIPSVGGGICQVATTVFQPVFFAGMPIEDRSWHLYWIPRYGNGPTGLKGLDATVDPDYDLDFTFVNSTDNWLAIKTILDGSHLTVELWGTNPGWEVQVDQPVITNVVRASQEMVYEQSSALPAGQQVFVEHAEDGFNAAIHRVVRKDGQVIEERTFNSYYAPARNVTLVGTGN
jgi:vancomycin resistance protein YoaR